MNENNEVVYSNIQSKLIYCYGCDIDNGPMHCDNIAFPCLAATCQECGFAETQSECEAMFPNCP